MLPIHEGELCSIQYRKSEEDVSNRVIIPSFVPKQNVTAIDVTDLSDTERDDVLHQWNEYQAYKKQQMSQLFTFDHFIEQTFPLSEVKAKWRTFDMSKMEVLSV